MEVRNNAEALKAFLGVSGPATATTHTVRPNDGGEAPAAFSGDQATLSRAGTEVSQAASVAGDRADRISAIQQALASGSYNVPASAVAGKLIDTMLESGRD